MAALVFMALLDAFWPGRAFSLTALVLLAFLELVAAFWPGRAFCLTALVFLALVDAFFMAALVLLALVDRGLALEGGAGDDWDDRVLASKAVPMVSMKAFLVLLTTGFEAALFLFVRPAPALLLLLLLLLPAFVGGMIVVCVVYILLVTQIFHA